MSGGGLHWALLLALVSATTACGGSEQPPVEQTPEAWVTIRGQRVAAELALTPAQQARGLGERDSLGWNQGMLFVYDEASFYAFWMKGMRFDIDIIWIRDDRVVDIAHRVQHVPGGNGPTVRPRELSETILEVPAGYAQSHGWRIGDRVEIER